jgi:hypothetical protein
MPKNEPKRHHFVPKFYLRQFADHKKRVRIYARGTTKKPVVTSVINAAVESGFYTIVEESGAESQSVEQLLSKIEGLARGAMVRMLEGRFPPDFEDRANLSLFMALQILRTPENRLSFEAMVDYMQKILFQGWTPDYTRERLREAGIETTDEAVAEIMDVVENPDKYRFIPHQNEHIRNMLTVATKLAPVIASRSWLMAHTKRQALVTSDHPVVWRSEPNPTNPLIGSGLGNAAEVYFPLDRHHALAMAVSGSILEGRTIELDRDSVLFINSLEAASSFKWIYQHPDDDPIDDLIPKKSRPLMQINQEPIFEPE